MKLLERRNPSIQKSDGSRRLFLLAKDIDTLPLSLRRLQRKVRIQSLLEGGPVSFIEEGEKKRPHLLRGRLQRSLHEATVYAIPQGHAFGNMNVGCSLFSGIPDDLKNLHFILHS